MATSVVEPTVDGDGSDVDPVPSRRSSTVLTGGLRTLWFVGVAVCAIQFILLVHHSFYLWDHFDLTADFGLYSQAWQQIATGHLNPYDTTYAYFYPHYGYSFFHDDLELLMWPLAPLYWIWPHAIDLLIAQDAALAGSALVAFRWTLEHLEVHAPNRRFSLWVGGCVLGIVVLQPWTYWAASFDFHTEPFIAFFILLAGRDLWAGRRRGWVFVACALLCSNVAGSYVIALGIAALISGRHRWRTGLLLGAAGAVWLAFAGLLHAGEGATFSNFAYLDGRTNVNDNVDGILTVLVGMVLHPSIWGHVVRARWGDIYKFVGGVGSAGIFSPLGVLAVAVLAPSALNMSPLFISDVSGAQNIMAPLAIAVGLAMVATWLTRQGEGRDRRWRTGLTALALVVAFGALVQTAVESAHWTPMSDQTFAKVDGRTAAELASVSARIPEKNEVIVSQGVSGRFGVRHNFFPYFDAFADGQTVPLFSHTVDVVLVPTQGIEAAPVAGTMAAVALMHRLGAHQLSARDGVYAFSWNVPKGRHSITFPPP